MSAVLETENKILETENKILETENKILLTENKIMENDGYYPSLVAPFAYLLSSLVALLHIHYGERWRLMENDGE